MPIEYPTEEINNCIYCNKELEYRECKSCDVEFNAYEDEPGLHIKFSRDIDGWHYALNLYPCLTQPI